MAENNPDIDDSGNVNDAVDQRIDEKIAAYDHEHDYDFEPGISEERARELIAEFGSGGGLTEEEAIALIQEYGGLPEDRINKLDSLIQRAEETLDKYELIDDPPHQWTVGPEAPSGDPHSNPLWGLHLSTDRKTRLGECRVRTNQAGTWTVRAYQYEGGEIIGVEDETVLTFRGQEQTVDLDLTLSPGEYLIARPIPTDFKDREVYDGLPAEAFVDEPVSCALYRAADYGEDAYAADSQHGVEFHGADSPVYGSSGNFNFYYFFNCTVATVEKRA